MSKAKVQAFDNLWDNFLPSSVKIPSLESFEIICDLLRLLNHNIAYADKIAMEFVKGRKEKKMEMKDPIHLTAYNLNSGQKINFETHDETQRLHVIEGVMQIRFAGEQDGVLVDAGEVFDIPKNTEHEISAVGGSARGWSEYLE